MRVCRGCEIRREGEKRRELRVCVCRSGPSQVRARRRPDPPWSGTMFSRGLGEAGRSSVRAAFRPDPSLAGNLSLACLPIFSQEKVRLAVCLCDDEFAPSYRSLLLTAELTRIGTESFGAAGRSALSSSCPPVLWVRAHEHECVWSKRAVLECVCQQVGECVCAPG